MKLLKPLLSRFSIYVFIILLQGIYLFILTSWFTELNVAAYLFSQILSLFIVIYLINKDENSNYKLSWVLFILSLPTLGGFLYLLMGNKNASRFLKKKIGKPKQKLKKYMLSNDEIDKEIIDDHLISLNYLCNMYFPIYKNTKVDYYYLGDDNYYDLLKDLKNAKKFIFMEYFIVSKGLMFNQIFSILREKVKEGVEVRFIYDDFGSVSTIPFDFRKILKSWGIKFVVFNRFVPIFSVSQNHRDHRKICVIDGNIGYSGGFNLADEYINVKERFGHWKDVGIRIEGDAVWSLTTMFLNTYYAYHNEEMDEDITQFKPTIQVENDGYILPYGDDPLDNEGVGENVYLNLIMHAKKEIQIMTPYFIIDDTMMKALRMASRNGVKIKLFTPHIPDKKLVFRVTRSYYYLLLMENVEIYEYTPGFLHAKVVLVDDIVATVGTINFDYRSLYLHFENNILLYKNSEIDKIKQDFEYTQSISTRMSLRRARYFRGVLEAILRIVSPLL